MNRDEFTNQELMLDVSDGHQLYICDWGSLEAKTVVLYLHGGPGGGTSDRAKTLFDPRTQRIIFYDQRGSGKSLPYGSRDTNTTQHLIADIVRIIEHFDLKQVVLFGNSWGSTLALAFGIAHPELVAGMLIAGVWTSRKSENDWLDSGALRTFYPEQWERFVQSVPAEKRDDPSAYHYDRALTSSDPQAVAASAFAVSQLEGVAAVFDDRPQSDTLDTFDPAGTLIEMHYIAHGCFFPENYILDNAAKLTMPIHIVQGRYDMVCPPVTAYELHQALPASTLTMTLSGHVFDHESWSVARLKLQQLTGGV